MPSSRSPHSVALRCFYLQRAFAVFLLSAIAGSSLAQEPAPTGVSVTRLGNGPIIGPDIHPSIGDNIQGPSLIKVPSWVKDPLGKYYLYFADHKGFISVSPMPTTCWGLGKFMSPAACTLKSLFSPLLARP
jgi:hypothetical protein